MFTLEEICVCTQGVLVTPAASIRVKGVSTDTRSLKAGDLFVALKGKNFDGHQFLSAAIARKASALLVSKTTAFRKGSLPMIRVADTLKAYCALAQYHRERFAIPVIALTGSVGKTTTKELIACVLSSRWRVLKNIQTENNEIGVAKTLLRLRSSHDLAVLEFGTNHQGEIKRLTQMGQPTVALMTNIGDAHLESFKTRRGVFQEKRDIVYASMRLSRVFLNADDPWLSQLARRWKHTPVEIFSIINPSNCQALRIRREGLGLSFRVGQTPFSLAVLGREHIYNALAAIAIGKAFQLSAQELQRALENFRFPRGRQTVITIKKRWVIDDTYNANPTSLTAALSALQSFPSQGKRFFVFGDMRELGPSTRKFHQQVGRLSDRYGVHALLTYGVSSRWAATEAKRRGVISLHSSSHDAIAQYLSRESSPGDVILIKGSRAMQMEGIIDRLKAFHF